ncbi:MAG: hypothetical protein FH751_12225 [Firmicutes bacterium]|nr:hypothetical protein [Bacillota bacterium]
MNKNVLKEIVSLKIKLIDSSVKYIDSKVGLPMEKHYKDLIEVINESTNEFINNDTKEKKIKEIKIN